MATYTATTNPNPVFGQSGETVKALQTALNTKNAGVAGYTPLVVDGKFGPLTQAAQNFQPQQPVSTAFTTDLPAPASNANDPYPSMLKADISAGAPDQNKIYNDTLSRYQAQIDAIKGIYANQLATARQQGVGRLGSGRAAAAASGNLGTTFGNAQADNIVTQNNGIEKAIQDEEAAKIGEILGKVNSDAVADFNAKKTALMTSAKAYSDYLAAQPAKVQQSLSDLGTLAVQKGITSADQIKPEDLSTIATKYGVSTDQIKLAINNAYTAKQKADADLAKDTQLKLGEGERVYDKNGKLIAYNPKTFAPKDGTGDDGKTLTPSDLASINKQTPLINLQYGETKGSAQKIVQTATQLTNDVNTAYQNPELTRNGYFTYDYITGALKNLPPGISRSGFLTTFKDKLNLSSRKAAMKGYGITKNEYDNLTSDQ